MRRFILSTMTLFVLILFSTMVWAGPHAPQDLKISPPHGMKATKTFVAFSHAKHGAAKVECVICHHTWDGKVAIQKCGSAGCHDQKGKKGKQAFYTAFHSKKVDTSCLGCHKIMKKNGKVVPVSCSSCHPK